MKRLPLHRRTRTILASLSREFGTDIPWAECFAEIAELDEAVRKCFEPAELDQLAILDEGVEVGGTRYYALTLNAEDWFEEWCRKFPDAPEMQVAGWLFAAAHSMEPEVLSREWNDKCKLAERVWMWRAQCGIKREQIAPLQRLLMPRTPWPKESRGPEDELEGYGGYGWLSATLGSVGEDPDYWKNKVPFLKALQRYRDLAMYGEADSEVKNRRWEAWRDEARAEEQVAIRRLKTAWKGFMEVAGLSEDKDATMPETATEEAQEAKETASEPAPSPAPPGPLVIGRPSEEQIRRMVAQKLGEAGGE